MSKKFTDKEATPLHHLLVTLIAETVLPVELRSGYVPVKPMKTKMRRKKTA
jgi:hypothetical protein